MGRGRRLAGLAMLAAAVLLSSPAAYGATAAQIHADLADGRLDGKYTNAELTAFLQNATAQGYPTPPSNVIGVAGVPTGVAGEEAGLLPFTGVDLALLAAGAAVLVLIGFGLRRLAAKSV
jgi:hypothetical protein